MTAARIGYRVRGRLAAELLAAHAIAPEDAIPVVPRGWLDRRRFARRRRIGAVREPSPGRFYLDLARHRADHVARGRAALPVAIVLAMLIAAGVVLIYP